jgi:hypothetical protein
VYEYVVTRGGGVVTAVWRDDVNQGTEGVPSGTQSFRPVSAGDYTIVSGGIAPFYLRLRFPTRQVSSSGTLVGIYADVIGFLTERHPIRGIQYLLSIDTDSWGLGQAIDTASFDAAAREFDALVAPDTLGLDGVLGSQGEQRPAIDYLREFLLITGARLALNSVGAWTIALDTPPTQIDLHLGAGPHVGEQNIMTGGAGVRAWVSEEDRARSVTLKYGLN